MLRKARLVRYIDLAIRQQHLTTRQAARRLGITDARLDLILNGRFRQEQADLLVTWLDQLGHRVVFYEQQPGEGQLGEFQLVPPLVFR